MKPGDGPQVAYKAAAKRIAELEQALRKIVGIGSSRDINGKPFPLVGYEKIIVIAHSALHHENVTSREAEKEKGK